MSDSKCVALDLSYFIMFFILYFYNEEKKPNIYCGSKHSKRNILNSKNKFRGTQKSLFLSEKSQVRYTLAQTYPQFTLHVRVWCPIPANRNHASSGAGCSRGRIEEKNQTVKIAVIAVGRLLERGLAERLWQNSHSPAYQLLAGYFVDSRLISDWFYVYSDVCQGSFVFVRWHCSLK